MINTIWSPPSCPTIYSVPRPPRTIPLALQSHIETLTRPMSRFSTFIVASSAKPQYRWTPGLWCYIWGQMRDAKHGDGRSFRFPAIS